MSTLFFDPIGGAAGDMILAALCDLGADSQKIAHSIHTTGLTEFELTIERRQDDRHIMAAFCTVTTPSHNHPHGHAIPSTTPPTPHHKHEHEHGHKHEHGHGRHLRDILALIEAGNFPARVKCRATRVFNRLADAEAAAHGIDREKVHFHEVGAVDSIVDILGVCLALEQLEVGRIYCSPLKIGRGTLTCAHGVLPVPAPATAKLIEGHAVVRLPVDAELTTPTGAAILTTLSDGPWEGQPVTVARCGTGHGTRNHADVPNVIRAYLDNTPGGTVETLEIIQTDIDDDTPERIAHVADRLRNECALDVTVLPVTMKKGRPALRLETLVTPGDASRKASDILLSETASIGVRTFPVYRQALPREPTELPTPWGPVAAKRVERPDGFETVPEYESCRELAEANGVPLRRVMQAATAQVS